MPNAPSIIVVCYIYLAISIIILFIIFVISSVGTSTFFIWLFLSLKTFMPDFDLISLGSYVIFIEVGVFEHFFDHLISLNIFSVRFH